MFDENDRPAAEEERVDRLLGALTLVPAVGVRASAEWSPAVCVVEQGQQLLIIVDLPGVPAEGLKVTATQHALVITGRRPLVLGVVRSADVPYGDFRRVVPLPLGVDVATSTASLKEGALEVRLLRAANDLT